MGQVTESHVINTGRIRSLGNRHAGTHRQHRQKGACQNFHHTDHNPAWPAAQQGQPPAQSMVWFWLGQKAQKVDLLANLGDQGKHHRRRRTKKHQIKMAAIAMAILCHRHRARIVHPLRRRRPFLPENKHKRQYLQHDPERLTPQLKAADHGDAVGNQRDHQQGAEQVTNPQWHAKQHVHRRRHDGRFDRKKNKRERGVNQRGNGRTNIAKPGTPAEQVDIHPIPGSVITDRNGGQKNQRRHHHDGRHRRVKAVHQRHRSANRFHRQKRNGPQRGVGNPRR